PYDLESNNGKVTMKFGPGCSAGVSSGLAPDDQIADKSETPGPLLEVDDAATSGLQVLVTLLSNWGPCPNPAACSADQNYDGVIDVADLLSLLENADF
ncbi:MAG: hypothetical protein O7G85_04885, partial [Planctomycetota bacterium]|nr:hypothetical protein [Planctomycetota bacterium]